jgi:hypothetical protein
LPGRNPQFRQGFCKGPNSRIFHGEKPTAQEISRREIPKPLRQLGWLQTFLESDIGRRIVAEALVAAAAAASAALVGTQTESGAKAGKAVKKAGKKGKHLVRDVVESAAGAASEVIGNAARSIMPSDDEEPGRRTRRNTTH